MIGMAVTSIATGSRDTKIIIDPSTTTVAEIGKGLRTGTVTGKKRVLGMKVIGKRNATEIEEDIRRKKLGTTITMASTDMMISAGHTKIEGTRTNSIKTETIRRKKRRRTDHPIGNNKNQALRQ